MNKNSLAVAGVLALFLIGGVLLVNSTPVRQEIPSPSASPTAASSSPLPTSNIQTSASPVSSPNSTEQKTVEGQITDVTDVPDSGGLAIIVMYTTNGGQGTFTVGQEAKTSNEQGQPIGLGYIKIGQHFSARIQPLDRENVKVLEFKVIKI